MFGRTIQYMMNDTFDYGKHLACIKGWLSDCTKTYKQKWAKMMFKK